MSDILVLLLVLVTNYMKTGRWVSRDCLTSLLRLGVGSLVWYFWARIVFPYLENLTGNLGTFNSSMTYSSRNTCQECATWVLTCPRLSATITVTRGLGLMHLVTASFCHGTICSWWRSFLSVVRDFSVRIHQILSILKLNKRNQCQNLNNQECYKTASWYLSFMSVIITFIVIMLILEPPFILIVIF